MPFGTTKKLKLSVVLMPFGLTKKLKLGGILMPCIGVNKVNWQRKQ